MRAARRRDSMVRPSFLIEQLARLSSGKIVLSDSSVSLKGMARELGGREAIADALKKLPEGFAVTENAIQAPPYVFQANKDPGRRNRDAVRLRPGQQHSRHASSLRQSASSSMSRSSTISSPASARRPALRKV